MKETKCLKETESIQNRQSKIYSKGIKEITESVVLNLFFKKKYSIYILIINLYDFNQTFVSTY